MTTQSGHRTASLDPCTLLTVPSRPAYPAYGPIKTRVPACCPIKTGVPTLWSI